MSSPLSHGTTLKSLSTTCWTSLRRDQMTTALISAWKSSIRSHWSLFRVPTMRDYGSRPTSNLLDCGLREESIRSSSRKSVSCTKLVADQTVPMIPAKAHMLLKSMRWRSRCTPRRKTTSASRFFNSPMNLC